MKEFRQLTVDDAAEYHEVLIAGYADTLEGALEMISPLSVLHIKVAPGSRKLTHRDYLGSVLYSRYNNLVVIHFFPV